MSTDDLSIHHTLTTTLQHDANQTSWEFVCPACDHRARYTIHRDEGRQRFEILHPGNPQARHSSNHVQIGQFQAADNDQESWLTPELRQQMEDLLSDVDLGDWDI